MGVGEERSGDMSEAVVLEKLLDLVSLEEKFHMTCGLHRKPCNLYCFGCGGNPICTSCKSACNHSQHADKIIQVYNATHKKAVLERDVAAFIDTTQIQKLINNGDTVLYIRSRRALRNEKESLASSVRACKTCVFSFPSSVMDHEIKFCSINCKVEYSPSVAPTKPPASTGGNAVVIQTSRKLGVPTTFRRRPRKQAHPYRSPLM